jgi:Phosphotransferase enzyme family
LPGRSLRDALRQGERRLPSGGVLVDLLDRLPPALAALPGRDSWRDRAPHYAAVVGSALPVHAGWAGDLGAEIHASGGVGPTVPIHGDFYEAQIHVHSGRLVGLLDVDTAGPGDRLDDLACLLGHLSVLAQIDRHRAPSVNALGARYLATFERAVDPVDLRVRVAAVVMSLATGPHRVQEPGWPAATAERLRLTESWLSSARVLRGEVPLTAATAVPHPAA